MTPLDDRELPPECRRALQALLVADPDALDGHLTTCEACRLAAREVLDTQTAIDAWLQDRVATRSVEDVLDRVHAAVAEERDESGHRRTILSLALAATLAAIALWALADGDAPTTIRPAPIAQPVAAAVGRTGPPASQGITVSADRRFALLETRRPTISVVWFY